MMDEQVEWMRDALRQTSLYSHHEPVVDMCEAALRDPAKFDVLVILDVDDCRYVRRVWGLLPTVAEVYFAQS